MSDKKKKFFFDLHNFTEGAEEDEGPPPPPTFSEEELAKAREEGYQKGKKDGFDESQQSLEKTISLLLENSKQAFLELQAAEQERENLYEREAVYLSVDVFRNIYPAWVAEFGPKEVENAISDVLKTAANQQNIKIEVAPTILNAIEERLEPITAQLSDIHLIFHGNDALNENDMRLKWDNGGAVRDSEKLAAHILQALTEDLPEKPVTEQTDTQEDLAEQQETRHNKTINTETSDE